ncbi:hypothetical protein GCM10009788_27160 [Nocardioides humi]|uniref:Uncharacterized protein n=1 Tax=Nocardioides humi TaxID=449461 RepID=A0ABN2ALX0_9ACTN
MEPGIPANSEHQTSRLQEALDTCQRELAAVRKQQEADRELIARGARAEEQLVKLSTVLDAYLVQRERRARWWGPLRPLVRPDAPTRSERADLALIHGSGLVDGPWYLRTYPATADKGLSPALHYLRRGAAAGKDPGPGFSTRAYRRQHPELPLDVNPLVHHLRSRR